MSKEINTDKYINTTLDSTSLMQQFKYLRLNMISSFKTFIYSKKLLIYPALAALPLLFSIIGNNKLLGAENSTDAFVGTVLGIFLLFFNFGVLIVILPLSSDETTDHVIDLYLVRPIHRTTLFTGRWIVATIINWLINCFIGFVYFLFYQLADASGSIVDNLDYLISMFWFFFMASFAYSGIFLTIGFIGNRGFTIGVVFAIVEAFFLSLLFLQDSRYIPRTHLNNIADSLFHPYYVYDDNPITSLFESYSYLFGFGLLFYAIGLVLISRKEFN